MSFLNHMPGWLESLSLIALAVAIAWVAYHFTRWFRLRFFGVDIDKEWDELSEEDKLDIISW